MQKLIAGYALDALEAADEKKVMPPKERMSTFIEELKNAQIESYKAIGDGEDIRMSSGKIAGGALVFQDRLIHLCAFHKALE